MGGGLIINIASVFWDVLILFAFGILQLLKLPVTILFSDEEHKHILCIYLHGISSVSHITCG